MNRLLLLITLSLSVLFFTACSDDRLQPHGQRAFPQGPIADLKIELSENPNDAEAWFPLADLYERNGQDAEERDALKPSLAVDGGSGCVSIRLGTAQNRLGRFDDAIASFESAKRYQPRNPVLYNNLAYMPGRKGTSDGEVAAFKQALASARVLEEYDEGAAASLRKAIGAERSERSMRRV